MSANDPSPTTPTPKRRNTYEGYAFGCAAAWALILGIARRRTDRETQKTLGRFCVGWWSGWISATIARVLYPPPKKLESEAYNRLVFASTGLVAVGVIRLVRFLLAGHNRR
jgi:hypothetical protein